MVVVLGEPARYLTRRGSKGRNCLQMGFGGILLGCVYEGIFRYVVVTSVRIIRRVCISNRIETIARVSFIS